MMKRTCIVAACALVAVLAAERPCPAMTSDALTGTSWDVTYSSAIRVTRAGRDTDTTYGTVTFNGDQTWESYEDDHGTDRAGSGTWALNRQGTKLKMRIDADGRASLTTEIADWLQAWADDDGSTLENLNVRVARAAISPANVRGTPTSFRSTLTAVGRATGRLNGRRVSVAFVHTSRALAQAAD